MKHNASIFLFVLFTFSFSSLHAQGYLMLAGGGSESSAATSWSAEPYGWFVEKSGEAPVVVLSNSDTSTWLPNYFQSLGAVEVINLTIQQHSESEILEALEQAGGVFFKGGDQRNYIDTWKGTAVQDAIVAVFDQGGVIGGTSAGAMIAGEFITRGGTTSDQLLRNPYAGQHTMQTGFLDLLPLTLVDTHYFERGRPGRLISKIAWIHAEWSPASVTGIGIDDKTAVMISPDGKLRVSGTGGVHVLRTTADTEFDVEPNQDLSVRNLKAHQLTHGFEINLHDGSLLAQPDDAFEVAPLPETHLSAHVHFRRNGWTTSYLNSRSDDTQRIILSSGEVPITAIENDEIPAEIIPYAESMIDDPAWVDALFASDRLFVNISPEQWKQLGGSSSFQSQFSQNSTEIELLMRHLPVMTDGYATNLSDGEFIAYDGLIQIREGSALFPHIVSVDSTYLNQNQFENRASAPGWLMHTLESHIALSGTRYSELSLHDGELTFGNQLMPAIITDAREGYFTAASPFIASGASNQTRNSAAVSQALIHVMPDGSSLRLYEQAPVSVNPGENSRDIPGDGFVIENAYPNPFNPSTTISIHASEVMDVRAEVFNILGQSVFSVSRLRLQEGRNTFPISLEGRSTGIYIVRVTGGGMSGTTRITLVK